MKVGEILGDDLALFKSQGKSDEEIEKIAKSRYAESTQKPQTQMISLNSKEPNFDDVPDWYKGEHGGDNSEYGVNSLINLGGDVLRGVGHTGVSYYNMLPLGDEFHEKNTKILQKLEHITETKKAKGRTPERTAEVQALRDEYSKADTFSEKFSAGFDTIVDTLANPSEWQVGEFIGENLDPINVLPAGRGIIAGATVGGLTNGVQAGAFAMPRTDKSDLDVAVDTALGATAGAALGGVTGGLTKKSTIKSSPTKEMPLEGEVLKSESVDENGLVVDPFEQGMDPVTLEAELVDKKAYDAFALIVQNEEKSVANADMQIKALGKEMKNAGASSEDIEIAIANRLKPSKDALHITDVLNDGVVMIPRLSGLNVQQAIVNSIQNPIKTTEQFYNSMLTYGATQEHALVAAKAYDAKEIAYYSTWAHDKLVANKERVVDVEGVKSEVKSEVATLMEHERIDEVLDMTPRVVTQLEDGTAHVAGATYSKNYAHDFLLTEAKVNRIENGRATPKDIEDLKADLDMIENNPVYALPSEADMRARYDELLLEPGALKNEVEFSRLQKKFDPETHAEAEMLFGDTKQIEEYSNDTSTTGNLAGDSSFTKTSIKTNELPNATGRGASGESTQQTSSSYAGEELPRQGDRGTSNSTPDVPGEFGNTELYKQDAADTLDGSTSRDTKQARSGGPYGDGVLARRDTKETTVSELRNGQEQSSTTSVEPSDRGITERIAAQKEAELTAVKPLDIQNIHDTLPILLKEQREDVIKAESRFLESNERGMLFTNGTGTGKTFTGLGIIKRFERMGKKDIVVLVPSEAKALDWINDAKLLNLTLRKLKDTKDDGTGNIVVTTYENFRDNAGLRQRSVDLVVADESHKIMGNKDGKHTQNLEALRQLTGHYTNAKSRAREHFSKELQSAIEGDSPQALKDVQDKISLMAREINSKTKTVFLSASPFASHKSLRYADDYLFNFDKNKWSVDGEFRGYNAGSDEDLFFIQNFGYKMRYNKLTRPDAEVNVDMMERAYAEKLRESGAMSGRVLNVDKDYQRAFVLVESDIGKKIDAGFERLNDDKEFKALRGVMRASYMDTVSLMESIKAQEAVSRIKGHLDAGRKVVVYHTFVDVNPSHPFRFDKHINDAVLKASKSDGGNGAGVRMRNELDREYAAFKVKYKDLYDLDLGELSSPTETISKAFGDDVVMFNRLAGSGKKKSANKDMFNNNEVDIIMVNESGKEGISLHDKLGDKQRVLVNLTLPIKPIDMIQVEGRIYRTGQKSDAIFEYLTLHTNFEKRYFGSSINERVATVENLAMGEQSRALRSAIKEGYMSAEFVEPSALDGVGGKAFDRRADGDKVMGNPFNYAKTLYFGKQKGRQNHRGADFFATPDPLGFKMVEWADIQANDRVLEPSAGVGAIGKWFPADSVNNFIEQSGDLYSDLTVAVQGKVQQMDFMQLDLHNKYDAIVMNPPFGRASVTAIQHLQKAMKHTSDGGRIVLLAPNNMMDKASFKKMLDDKEFSGWVLQDEMKLPEQTFERAGTKAMTSVYVFNKTSSKDKLDISKRYTKDIQAENINQFFDEIESLDVDKRDVPRFADEVDAEVSKIISGVIKAKESKNKIVDFVRLSSTVADERIVVKLNDLSDDFIEMIKAEIGLDLNGYIREIDNYSVRHILKKHGSNYEIKRGQLPIDENDIALIPQIIDNAHKITLSKNKIGRDVIEYESYVGDKYFYFEEVRTKHNELIPQTMYKKRDEILLNGEPLPEPLTPKATSLSADSITHNGINIRIGTHIHTKTGVEMTVVKLGDKLDREAYKNISSVIKKHGGFWSRLAKGFLFKDEAKAQRFKDGVSDGSVKLNSMFIPYADKIVDVMMNFDKYADKIYDKTSNFVRDVDADGIPKAVRESKSTPHAMANNVFGWLRDNMVLGGGRANHYLGVLRDYTNMKARIADEALKTKNVLDNMLSKEDSQDLVRALGGDLPHDELSVNTRGAYELYRGLIDIQTDKLIEIGALDEKYAHADYVKRYYFEHIAKEKSFVNMKGSAAHSKKYARADIDLDERIELGQIEDAGYVVAKTIMEQKDQLNRATLFKKIADEVAVDEALDGFVQVPDSKAGIINKWGALNGKYVPSQVWDDLKGSAKMFDDLTGIEQFVAWWMSTIQHIKTNMTVKNPGTHVYNVLSNGYIAYLDGHMVELGRVLKDRALYKQLHNEANMFGLDSMLDDLEGVVFKENSNDGVLTSLLKNAYMAEGTTLGNAMRTAYAHEDAAFKIAAYLKRKEAMQREKFLAQNPNLKAEYDSGMVQEGIISLRYNKDIQNIYLSEDEMRMAFEGVDEVYVNYGTPLPSGVKNLDRSGLFPFMHYTWKATPIFMKQMMRHPYKVGLLHVMAGSYGLSKIWGESDDREEVTPEYMNDGFNMLGLDNFKEINEGEYLNIGRSVPGMRFMNKSPVSIFLGLDGGILANLFGITVQGIDNKGFSVDGGKYDNDGVKMAKRASALAEQAMPPLFPALPVVIRPKRDSRGNKVDDTTEVVAIGGRYFQKVYDAAAGKKDKRGNPLLVTDVLKQSVGAKLQKVDKLQYAQKSVNAARRLYEREYNLSDNSRNRVAASRKYKETLKKVKAQLPRAQHGKLKIKTSVPGQSKRKTGRFITKQQLIKL